MSTSRFNLRGLRDRDEAMAFGKDLREEIKSDDVASLAAAVSFKIVLALFPALLAAVAIYALVADPEDLQGLLANLPASVTEALSGQLDDFIDQAASGGVAVVGIAIGLWAASGAAATLDRALTRAYDENEGRKLVAARGTALAVTVALLLALIAISILLVAGGAIENRIIDALPLTATAAGVVDFFATLGRYAVAVILLMLLFAFIYWIGPDYEERPGWAWITPGAALAVVTWLLASALFGWYVSNFGSYTESDSIYGPLGNAIVFMLWLQLSMLALLLGAEVNQILQLRARRLATAEDARAGSAGRATPPSAVTGATSLRASTAGAGAHLQMSDDGNDAGTAGNGDDARRTRSGGARDGDADGAVGTAQRGERPRSGRAVAVHDHRDGGDSPPTAGRRSVTARDRRPAATDDQRIPVPTMVGAAVAAVSSVVGLAGLLRRLKGE